MSPLGTIHVALALLALGAGAVVALLPKGTAPHRRLGWVYVGAMLGLNATALMIYRLLGRFGPFHVAALASLLTLVVPMAAVLRRRPKKRWLEIHARMMAWSYVGLLAALTAETMTRLRLASFWWVVAGSTLAVVLAGRLVIARRVPTAIRALAAGARRPARAA